MRYIKLSPLAILINQNPHTKLSFFSIKFSDLTMGMQLVFIGTIALCLVVSSAVLEQFEQAPKQDGSLSFLVIGDWGRKGAYNQS